MTKLHQVTVPQGAFADFRNYLAGSESSSHEEFRIALATLLAPMIGHIRLFQATNDEPRNVLEWSIDTDSKAKESVCEAINPTARLEQASGTTDNSRCPQGPRDIDLYLGLSLDPLDESLSIEVATEPVLEGESLTALAALSSEAPEPVAGDFDMPDSDGLSAATLASYPAILSS